MTTPSMYDRFNEQILLAIATGDLTAVIAVLQPDDAQAMVHLAHHEPVFLPGLMLRNTLHQLRAACTVGPWALSDLPDLVGGTPESMARASGYPGQTPLMAVIGGFDALTPTPLRQSVAQVLVPLLMPHQDPNRVDDQGLTALGWAIRVHHQEAFDHLWPVTDLVKANAQARQGDTLLLEAVQHGSLAMVQRLLPVSDPTVQDLDGNGVLHRALMREDKLGDRAALIALLLPLASRWTTNVNDDTPLQMAVHRRDETSVEQLMAGYTPPRNGPVQWGLQRAYSKAVTEQRWALVQTIVTALPESLGRAWLNTSIEQNLLRRELTPVLDVANRIWEARLLRAEVEQVTSARPLAPVVRARL